MSAPQLMPAAKKGDRIAHESRFDDRDGSAMLAATIGGMVSGDSCASTSAKLGQASGGGSLSITIRDVVPHGTTGELEEGSPDVFVLGLPVAVSAQHKVNCHRHRDKPIKTGSASVFVDKKRMARVADETCCGALIVDGAKTVLVGGAPVDDAPSDPLAALERGAAVLGAALGGALTKVENALDLATGYADKILGKAEGAIDAAADGVEHAVSTIASKASAALGDLEGAVLGAKGGDVASPK